MIWIAAGIVLSAGLLLLLRWRNKRSCSMCGGHGEILYFYDRPGGVPGNQLLPCPKCGKEVNLPEVRTKPQPIPFTPIQKKKPRPWEVKSKRPSRKFPLHQQMKRCGAIGG